jgi:hypothetical protein
MKHYSTVYIAQVPELEERLREIHTLMGLQETSHQESDQLNSD